MSEALVVLPRSWFERHPVEVAFDLIGKWFVVDRDGRRVVTRIVETEAYGGDEDLASHATMYKIGRQTLMSDPGVLYMQFAYGMHTMTNLVSHLPIELGAVLLRSAEDPVEGLDVVANRFPAKTAKFLVGPGNLSRGMGTTLGDTLSPLTVETGIVVAIGPEPVEVRAGTRIGITRAAAARWRFFDGGSRFVSRHRRGEPVTQANLPAIIGDLPR